MLSSFYKMLGQRQHAREAAALTESLSLTGRRAGASIRIQWRFKRKRKRRARKEWWRMCVDPLVFNRRGNLGSFNVRYLMSWAHYFSDSNGWSLSLWRIPRDCKHVLVSYYIRNICGKEEGKTVTSVRFAQKMNMIWLLIWHAIGKPDELAPTTWTNAFRLREMSCGSRVGRSRIVVNFFF